MLDGAPMVGQGRGSPHPPEKLAGKREPLHWFHVLKRKIIDFGSRAAARGKHAGRDQDLISPAIVDRRTVITRRKVQTIVPVRKSALSVRTNSIVRDMARPELVTVFKQPDLGSRGLCIAVAARQMRRQLVTVEMPIARVHGLRVETKQN